MKIINVTTGFGYFTETATGNIISKAELPIGEHFCQNNFTYVEVATKEALDLVTVYKPPLTQEQKDKKNIYSMQRKLAIIELKSIGKIDAEFVEPVIL